MEKVFTGGDAARGGSTAIRAAGDGQAAAREIVGDITLTHRRNPRAWSGRATTPASAPPARPSSRRSNSPRASSSSSSSAPLIAKTARAGQFVRVLALGQGRTDPADAGRLGRRLGTITIVVQAMGTSSIAINNMKVGDAFTGIAGPLGLPSALHRYEGDQTVVFTAGGVGLPPVYPIMREHLRLGNHVTLISGFRNADLLFWTKEDERVGRLQAEFAEQLDGDLHQQRRQLRHQGLRHRPARGRCSSRRRRARGARSPKSSPSARR